MMVHYDETGKNTCAVCFGGHEDETDGTAVDWIQCLENWEKSDGAFVWAVCEYEYS